MLQDAIRTYFARTIAGRQAQRVRVLEHRTRLDHPRAGFLGITGTDRLQPAFFWSLLATSVGQSNVPGGDVSSETRGVLDFLVRGIDEQLLRHAAADHASAAHAAPSASTTLAS